VTTKQQNRFSGWWGCYFRILKKQPQSHCNPLYLQSYGIVIQTCKKTPVGFLVASESKI